MTRPLASLLRNREGSAGVEMALVTPLLIILLFASFEAGNYLWDEHVVVKAVRDGARFAGRQSFGSFNCSAVTNSTALSQIKNLTRTGLTTGGTARLVGWTNNHVTVSVSCASGTTTGIYTNLATGAPVVRVTAAVPYQPLFGTMGFNTASLQLRATSQAAVMGL